MLSALTPKLGSILVILFGASIITFLFMFMIPGDPAWTIARGRYGESTITPEMLAEVRAETGLDQPLPIQYARWLANVVTGDLGISFLTKEPVGPYLGKAFLVTLQLTVISLVLSLILALPLGLIAALKPLSWIDTASTTISQFGISVPEYWLGPVLVLIFSVHFGVLPSAEWGDWKHMVLPAVVLGFRPLSYFTRMIRVGLVDVLRENYIRTAHAKGLAQSRVIGYHALRNALIPLITVVGLQFAGLLGGSVIVEVIFAVPGVGRLLYQSVMGRDLPVIQAGVLLVVGAMGVANVLADCVCLIADPTLRCAED